MNRAQVWAHAIRPKTLIASISPVLIACASLGPSWIDWTLFWVTLATALGIQITTNLVNDYCDFIKGADTAERKGFLRVTQAGLVTKRQMKRSIAICAMITLLSGCYLALHGGVLISLLLALSLLLAFLYTAGPCPLAYLGLGEVFVFLFFGPIAVGGALFLQLPLFSREIFLLGIGPGALSCAILVLNNLRDIDEDAKANKKTLAVRFGKNFAKAEYLACMGVSFIPVAYFCQVKPWVSLSWLLLIPSFFLCKQLFDEKKAQELNSLFVKTGQFLWLYTLLFCIGCLL